VTQLRDLLQGTSAGPWEAVAMGSEGYHVMGPVDKPPPGRRGRIASVTGRKWGEDKANALAIVALHNAADLLCDVVEASRPRPYESCWRRMQRIDDALAALDKHLAGTTQQAAEGGDE
jgi:hypothetical protein